MNACANLSAPHTPAPSPFDVLAEELGAVAGRIEREASLRIAAAISDLERRDAERELRLVKLEQAIAERLASLRDGEDGTSVDRAEVADMVREEVSKIPAPKDGKDADLDEVAAIIAAEVKRAADAIRVPLDGVGIAGVEIRDGSLVVVLTDGTEHDAGQVVGKDGKDGKLPTVKAWDDRVHYEGEVVRHGGSTWQALKDTGQSPPHADWACIASCGRDGAEPEPRGLYDPNAEYRRLNIVALDGGSFIAKRDDPGPCPGDGWHLLVSRGKPGKPGEGKKGDPGDDGLPGASIIAGALDTRDMALLLTRDDGEVIKVDLYEFAMALRSE